MYYAISFLSIYHLSHTHILKQLYEAIFKFLGGSGMLWPIFISFSPNFFQRRCSICIKIFYKESSNFTLLYHILWIVTSRNYIGKLPLLVTLKGKSLSFIACLPLKEKLQLVIYQNQHGKQANRRRRVISLFRKH